MNAKQRKQADMIRQRALLGSDAKLKNIEALSRQLAADKATFEAQKSEAIAELTAKSASIDRAEKTLREAKANALKDWLEEKDRLEEVNIIREVLLQLELDEDPMIIALNIRKQFGMIIPEW